MKKTVRILSLVMALMMVLGLASVFAATAGAEEVTPSVTVKSATLLYRDEIQIRYCMEAVGVNTADVKLYVWNSKDDADAHSTDKAAQTLDMIESEGNLYAITDGIPAKNMADKQYVAANAGNVWSAVITYSPADYAANITANSESQAQKNAVAALMAYGAAAQTYFGYNTDALMNAGFAALEDQKVYADEAYVTEIPESANGLAPYSATMLFEGKISYAFRFTSTVEGDAEYFADCENYATGEKVRVPMTRDGNGRYVAILPALAVRELNTVYSVTAGYIQNGEEKLGCSMKYSALHYAKRMAESTTATANGKALAIAMANYYYYVNLALNGAEEPAGPVDETITFAADKAQRTVFETAQQVWANGDVTFTNDKAASTNGMGDYSAPVRLYKSSKITVTAKDAVISKVVFNCNTAAYAKTLNTSLTNAGYNPVVSDKAVTVELEPATKVECSLSDQIRIDSIVVTYTKITACTGEHTFGEWTVSKEATCTEEGLKTATCTACYTVTEEAIPATGHTAGKFAYDENRHWNLCATCNTKVEGTDAAHNFVGGKCECGYESGAIILTDPTQAAIVEAAYALENKATMENQTLTGVISTITEAYGSYKNITLIIVIGELTDKPILCYRMAGGEDLKVGDKITVTGTLTNYNGTIEFNTGCTYEKVAADDTCEHIYNNGYVSQIASCTQEEETTQTCYLCGMTLTKVTGEKLAHTPVWAYDEDLHWNNCGVCGEELIGDLLEEHKLVDGKCDCGYNELTAELEEVVTAEIAFTRDTMDKSISSYTDTWTATSNNVTWTIKNFNNNKQGWDYIKAGRNKVASVAYIYLPTENVTKVELTVDKVTAANINSVTVQILDKDGNSVATLATFLKIEKGTLTVELNWGDYEIPEGGSLAIVFDCAAGTANGLIQVSKVTCYGYKEEA